MLGLLKKMYEKEILIIGCGNSKVGECLYIDGYKNITSIDFSNVIIEEMNKKYSNEEEMDCIKGGNNKKRGRGRRERE